MCDMNTLFGRPVIPTDFSKKLGNIGDISFGWPDGTRPGNAYAIHELMDRLSLMDQAQHRPCDCVAERDVLNIRVSRSTIEPSRDDIIEIVRIKSDVKCKACGVVGTFVWNETTDSAECADMKFEMYTNFDE